MADFTVTGHGTTQKTVKNGTGMVAEGAKLVVGEDAAIVSKGDSQITIAGKVGFDPTQTYHNEPLTGIRIKDGSLDLTITETGSLSLPGSAYSSAIAGSINGDSNITNAGLISSPNGINLYNANGSDTLKIENTGDIFLPSGIGYTTEGGSISVNNSGHIGGKPITGSMDGQRSIGVTLRVNEGSADKASMTVNNSGTTGNVIMITPEESEAWADINNTGTIERVMTYNSDGDPFKVDGVPTVATFGSKVINSGTINEYVQLGNLSDTYDGTGGTVNGEVLGDYGNDTLIGGSGDEVLRGEQDNDFLQGNGGNDVLDGGEGTDTVALSGSSADYTFSRNADGSVTASGKSGNDQLIDIEQVDFLDDTDDAIDLDLLLDGNGGGVDGTEFIDTPGQTQYLTAPKGDGVFVINGSTADYGWCITEDGTGTVVWNKASGSHDILWGFEEIAFNDQTISLGGNASNEYTNIAGTPQYLFGAEGTDRFVIEGKSSDYQWDQTQDGEGIVVWETASGDFNLLYDFEEIEFNDAVEEIA